MSGWKYKTSDTCKTDECNRTVRVKGFCENCYTKSKQYEYRKKKER